MTKLSNVEGRDSSKNLQRSQKPVRESIIKAKVAEYIEILLSTMQSSTSNRKFTFYRNIDLIYNIDNSNLTIISEEDGKSTIHVLAELAVVDDLMIQLICEDED